MTSSEVDMALYEYDKKAGKPEIPIDTSMKSSSKEDKIQRIMTKNLSQFTRIENNKEALNRARFEIKATLNFTRTLVPLLAWQSIGYISCSSRGGKLNVRLISPIFFYSVLPE